MASAPARLLPRRDDEARAALSDVARRHRPVSAAHERVIPVPGPLGELLPNGALTRGAVVGVEGVPGAGASSVALTLAAAVTAVGEWAAAIDLEHIDIHWALSVGVAKQVAAGDDEGFALARIDDRAGAERAVFAVIDTQSNGGSD